jgi:hypothetical protein
MIEIDYVPPVLFVAVPAARPKRGWACGQRAGAVER